MYSVAIIGAGLISSGYDNPEDNAVLTHAHAVNLSAEFKLDGFFDVDTGKAQDAAKKWNTTVFQSIDEIKSDVIVVATPDKFHKETVKQVLGLYPKLIILEKPVSDNLQDGKTIVELTENTPTAVNFSRRFVKEFQNLKDKIKNGDYGDYISGRGIYGKGFIHNGSHMIDLLNMLVGNIREINVIDEFNDYFENDPSKTVSITFDEGRKFLMQAIDCNAVTVFELDLFFERKRIKILSSGKKFEYYDIKTYENGYKFTKFEKEETTESDFAMLNLYKNVSDFLNGKTPLYTPINEVFEEKLYV